MIGSLQWCVSLGRIDIQTATMAMSSFKSAPRKVHRDRLKRIYSYISKMRHAAIRVMTAESDLSALPEEPNV